MHFSRCIITLEPKTVAPNLIKAVLSGIEYIVVYFFGFTHPFLKERIEHLEFAHRIIQKADNNQNA